MLVSIAVSLAFVAGSSGSPSCSIPRDAALSEAHGFYYYVYPRKMHKDFSGFQFVWDEHGRLVVLTQYVNGEISLYVAHDYDPEKTVWCKYGQGILSDMACPPPDDLDRGFAVGPVGTDPDIPTSSDLRCK